MASAAWMTGQPRDSLGLAKVAQGAQSVCNCYRQMVPAHLVAGDACCLHLLQHFAGTGNVPPLDIPLDESAVAPHIQRRSCRVTVRLKPLWTGCAQQAACCGMQCIEICCTLRLSLPRLELSNSIRSTSLHGKANGIRPPSSRCMRY